MSEPFLAEIRIVAFNFAPRGHAFCDGQILQIQQNQSLYSLLGTTYGGDGRISFALPDLRGRVPEHDGPANILGQRGGAETTALVEANLPAHRHAVRGTAASANAATPGDNVLANTADLRRAVIPYGDANNLTPMAATDNMGASQPVSNMQPYLALHFCIALSGIFPSRN